MKKNLLAFLLMASPIVSMAQYAMGHLSTAFTDASRNNRNVTCEIFYPASAAGESVDPADGSFPYVVFGHGFVMNYDAYQNIWEYLVPEGYVMVFATTETGLPSHENFGLDLAFLTNEMASENEDSGSLFFGHLTDKSAIMGHSMGGGATWLAAASNPSIECIVGLAPAETNPSAIAAAASVTVPVLVISGSADGVTPPADNHQPIYDASASACKYYVSLVDGSHCGFADQGSLCDLGEFGFNGMTREVQQAYTHEILQNWLDFFLTENNNALMTQQDFDDITSDVILTISCTVGVNDMTNADLYIWPNPSHGEWQVQIPFADTWQYELTDASGRLVERAEFSATKEIRTMRFPSLKPGCYILRMTASSGKKVFVQQLISQ